MNKADKVNNDNNRKNIYNNNKKKDGERGVQKHIKLALCAAKTKYFLWLIK